MKDPTIYVITNHQFNHATPRRDGKIRPLDSRFLESKSNYVYYLIDKEVPEILRNKKTILEYDLDKDIYEAGGKYFGEWSFLLAEEKHAFCHYPFFMISSRFYEKNSWLVRTLDEEWTQLFDFLGKYRWGYLPSYDRPLRWIDYNLEKDIQREAWRYKFFPWTEKTLPLVNEVFKVHIPQEYRYTADLFCNYIGFNSRADLLEYVSFYKPLIHRFFDNRFQKKADFSPYVKNTGAFTNEKSFTFLLELLCHLFFFKNKHPYFAMHYDGYYFIDESSKKMKRIKKTQVPLFKHVKRLIKWQWRRTKSEGYVSTLKGYLQKYKTKI
jgi:hypothetical protein